MQAVNMISNAYNWQIKGTTSKSSQQRRQLMMSATTMSTLSIARTTAKNNGDNEQTINSKNMHRKNRNTRFCLGVENMLLFVVLVLLSMTTTVTAGGQQIEAAAPTTSTRMQFSLPLTTMSGDLLNDDDNFRPIIPKDVNPEFISRNVFTKSGHYRVFQPLDGESDLRVAVAVKRKDYVNNVNDLERTNGKVQSSHKPAAALSITTARPVQLNMTEKSLSADKRKGHEYAKAGVPSNEVQGRKVKMTDDVLPKEMDEAVSRTAAQQQSTVLNAEVDSTAMHNELKGLEELLIDYVENFFSQGKYEPLPGLVLELQKNHTSVEQQENNGDKDKGNGNGTGSELKRHVRRALADTNVSVNLPRAMESGRLLFGVGVKKLLWPIYMGFQVLKSLLFALFLPTLIGSVSRLIGKGITSGSAGSVPLFVRPMDTPQDLDFRDNNFSFDDDGKFSMNTDDAKDNINQAASQTQSQYTPYNAATINQMALDRQHQHMMQDTYLSALQSIGAASFKNSQGISSGSSGGLGGGGMSAKKPASPANMNTFQTFQKVPATSLLLSNYDPFYSPLLSRLDSVFAQLKLNSENEHCREKLICLMYANPAKYAPYSNLVSAQLSRELNELRKPTSDNPDILRFFKYMRAAKDGQDGIDCEQSFAKCQEFKDFENPAMLSTYNDINKLVQARKFA